MARKVQRCPSTVEAPMRVISVSIVDPHPVFREGAARIVRRDPEMRLVAEWAAAPPIAELAGADVLIADPLALIHRGETLLRGLALRRLPTRVLLVASVVREGDAYRALGAGAAGYLSKCSDERALTDAIRRVARGGTVIAPELQGDVARGI